MALGARLRLYKFDRYKTKKKEDDENGGTTRITFAVADPVAARKAAKTADGLAEGVGIARDLVNEPPNVLGPEEFANRAAALAKLGVEVEVLDEKALRKLGMRALLAVGQGSARESRVVLMRWNGGKASDKPVAFVGKGVVFDTGGISIKPGGGMEDMKGDMAGAACVVGLMHALAAPKGAGERHRRDRPRREHARRRRPAPGRHRHLDVRPDGRDHQHRRRGPARARRRALARAASASSRRSWSTSRR